MKPSSSPMTEKMKSVWALGRNPHCAWPPPRPAPTRWPEPKPINDCIDLVARPRAVGRRVQEGEQPVPPVRRDDGHDEREPDEPAEDLENRPETDTGDEQAGPK